MSSNILNITANNLELEKEIMALIQKCMGTADRLNITTVSLQHKLFANGISCTDQEMVDAINALISRKQIILGPLCFEHLRLGVWLFYPAIFSL